MVSLWSGNSVRGSRGVVYVRGSRKRNGLGVPKLGFSPDGSRLPLHSGFTRVRTGDSTGAEVTSSAAGPSSIWMTQNSVVTTEVVCGGEVALHTRISTVRQ